MIAIFWVYILRQLDVRFGSLFNCLQIIFFLKSLSRSLKSHMKGQMNQQIKIFCFNAIPSPNTNKSHLKWDLGKDISSQAFIDR